MQYKRILLKLSGEALMGERQYGIDPKRLAEYAKEIKQVVDQGIEVAIVIGGGNIFRGVAGAANGMDRVQGDHMGMLATCINGLALQSALEDEGVITRLQNCLRNQRNCRTLYQEKSNSPFRKKTGRNFWCWNRKPLLHHRYCSRFTCHRSKCRCHFERNSSRWYLQCRSRKR